MVLDFRLINDLEKGRSGKVVRLATAMATLAIHNGIHRTLFRGRRMLKRSMTTSFVEEKNRESVNLQLSA